MLTLLFSLYHRLSAATAPIAFIIFVNLWVIDGASYSDSDTILLTASPNKIFHSGFFFSRLTERNEEMWSRRKWKNAPAGALHIYIFILHYSKNKVLFGMEKLMPRSCGWNSCKFCSQKSANPVYPHISNIGMQNLSSPAEPQNIKHILRNTIVFMFCVWHIFVIFFWHNAEQFNGRQVLLVQCLRKPINFVAYLCAIDVCHITVVLLLTQLSRVRPNHNI